MDLSTDTPATPPDCWKEFGQMMSVIENSATTEELHANLKPFGEAFTVAGSGAMVSKAESAIEFLVETIENRSTSPEAIFAADCLATWRYAPEVVLPFCAKVLHEILAGDKLSAMEDVAVEAIEVMSYFGEDAAPHGLEVMGCLLLDHCPVKVKHAALQFLFDTAISGTSTVVFEKVLRESADPDIVEWAERQKWDHKDEDCEGDE